MAEDLDQKNLPDNIRDSDDLKTAYSQVQSWTFTDTDVVMSFYRFEPESVGGPDGVRHNVSERRWVREAVIYIPIDQVESVAKGLLQGVKSTGRSRAPKD